MMEDNTKTFLVILKKRLEDEKRIAEITEPLKAEFEKIEEETLEQKTT